MSDRQEAGGRLIIEGRPYFVRVISNPTIDDVVVTEMRIRASEIEQQKDLSSSRRVARDIRDFLIRLGVER